MKGRQKRPAQKRTGDASHSQRPMTDVELAKAFTVVGKGNIPERLRDIELPKP